MSRINSKIEELARLKYTRQAAEISTSHHREIQRLGDPRRSGAVKVAIDKELVEMARECAIAPPIALTAPMNRGVRPIEGARSV
jgi:hypothetical protein